MTKFRNTQAQTSTAVLDQDQDRVQRLGVAFAAALFGTFLMLGIGFSHASTIHNAAHDGRHSFAMPCH